MKVIKYVDFNEAGRAFILPVVEFIVVSRSLASVEAHKIGIAINYPAMSRLDFIIRFRCRQYRARFSA